MRGFLLGWTVLLAASVAMADPPRAGRTVAPGTTDTEPPARPTPVNPRGEPGGLWTTAPDFTLESTTGATRRRRNFAGRVMVILYEDRGSNHQNDALKDELAQRARRSDLAMGVALLPVADLHAYDFWPAAGYARSAVVDIARTIGVEILMDWSGDMATAYRFASGQSHVVVINRNGDVSYRFDGPLDAAQRERFFTSLEAALQAGE